MGRFRLFPFGMLLLASAVFAMHGGAQQLPQPLPDSSSDLQTTYARLLTAIQKIPIFDNHGHPGFADDADVDAMVAPPGSVPLRLRSDNPELISASKDLFDYPYNDATPEHLQWLTKKKAELRQQQTGYAYFNSILDRLNIETALANRVRMPPYLDPKRFRWVFFVDSVLFPFNNQVFIGRNGDLAVYVPLQEKKLHYELAQEGLVSLPGNLTDYLLFVRHLLEDSQRQGGVAIKVEIGYFRPLHFDDPPQAVARTGAVYAAKYRGLAEFLPMQSTRTFFRIISFATMVQRGRQRCIFRCTFILQLTALGDFYHRHRQRTAR